MASTGSPWMLPHADEERERVLTRVPTGSRYERVARQERVKAALTVLLEIGECEVLDMLGIPADEIALARQVANQLGARLAEQGKRCPRCRTTRPRTQWYPNPATSDGLSPWCAPCHQAKARS